MATVQIRFNKPMDGIAPVESAKNGAQETITSGAGNTVSTVEAWASNCVGTVTAADGNVYVSFGQAPDATSDPDRILVIAGTTRSFGNLTGGDVCAVTDAA